MKTRKLLITVFLMLVLAASFVSASIESSKNDYLTTEVIYVKSTAILCSNLPTDEEVFLYIVENRDEWFGGEFLDDVRGEPKVVLNSQFTSKKIWENPKAGFYDIIVDCTGDEEYTVEELGSEPIDGLFSIGFSVTAVTGGGSAEIGGKDAGDSIWRYDPEDPDLINEMLQLTLLAADEDIILENITIQASGAGDDTKISVEVFADENNNGKAEEDEIIISDTEIYPEDDGVLTIVLDYVLTRDLEENILIIYRMEEYMEEGEFSLRVESVYGVGENSEEIIRFSGLPLNSGTKTIMSPKTCLGELTLSLEPNPASEGSRVTATMAGLTGCQNKTVVLRINPCGSSIEEKVGSCIIAGEDEGCEISFIPSASKTYHACIDKNENGGLVDFGEYAFEDLVVTETLPEPPENVTEVNVTESNVSEDSLTGFAPITGGAIDEFKDQLAETGSFFILLEVTLLLILFVLTMIMFRLRPSRKKGKSEKKEEEEDED